MEEVRECVTRHVSVDETDATNGLARTTARTLKQDVSLFGGQEAYLVFGQRAHGDIGEVEAPVIRQVRGTNDLGQMRSAIFAPVTGIVCFEHAAQCLDLPVIRNI